MTTRQNGTFCLGVLGLYGGPAVVDQLQTILTALQPRLADAEDPSVRDNAVGALSRLVLAFGATLPLDAIVGGIVSRLPLKADHGENGPAARALIKLAQADGTRPHLAPHLGGVLAAFGRLLTSDAKLSTDALKAELRAFLKWLAGVAPDVCRSLPADVQAQLVG